MFDLPLDSLGSILGGAAGAGGVGLFIIKMIWSRLDKHEEAQNSLLRMVLENKAQNDLLWRENKSKEINIAEIKEQHKASLEKIEAQFDKQWGILGRLANPRVSDILHEVLNKIE